MPRKKKTAHQKIRDAYDENRKSLTLNWDDLTLLGEDDAILTRAACDDEREQEDAAKGDE